MSTETNPVFLYKEMDPLGRMITLEKERWIHTLNHTEMIDYYEEIRTTIKDPQLIYQNASYPNGNLYFNLGVGKDKFKPLYLAVAVQLQDQYNGVIKTAHFQPDLSRCKDGGLLYVRPKR